MADYFKIKIYLGDEIPRHRRSKSVDFTGVTEVFEVARYKRASKSKYHKLTNMQKVRNIASNKQNKILLSLLTKNICNLNDLRHFSKILRNPQHNFKFFFCMSQLSVDYFSIFVVDFEGSSKNVSNFIIFDF
jgi:hypothetical protein